jgi:hypothetical protein
VRFSYVTILRVEEIQAHMLLKPKTLPVTASYKYCRWEILLVVWTVYVSLPVTLPTPLIPLSLTSNERGTHGFVLTTEHILFNKEKQAHGS